MILSHETTPYAQVLHRIYDKIWNHTYRKHLCHNSPTSLLHGCPNDFTLNSQIMGLLRVTNEVANDIRKSDKYSIYFCVTLPSWYKMLYDKSRSFSGDQVARSISSYVNKRWWIAYQRSSRLQYLQIMSLLLLEYQLRYIDQCSVDWRCFT